MLNVYISLLFTCMFTHGMPPSGLLLTTIAPIPKNKRGNLSDSSNYRAIAPSSLLCKLLDTIIIEKHEANLISDDLQFGYKKQSSTIECTSSVLNTVEYYRENDSDCYILLLDASKPFDRVEYLHHLTQKKNHGYSTSISMPTTRALIRAGIDSDVDQHRGHVCSKAATTRGVV